MLSLASESLNYILGKRTTLSCKMQQTVGTKIVCETLNPLEGSVALCTVKGNVLTKRHRADAKDGLCSASSAFRTAGLMLEFFSSGASVAMSGLADACERELDVEHEFKMQIQFGLYCKNTDAGVLIPQPLSILRDGNGITMEYIEGATRFCDSNDDAAKATAVVLVSRMFFSAIQDQGLIYGDMSPTNVLLDLDKKPCLVDFGCCVQLDDHGESFRAAKEEIDGQVHNHETDFVIQLWEEREWADGWEQKLDAVKVDSLSFDGREKIPGIALYLRSLMALTLMARQVSPRNMRIAEHAWRTENPVKSAHQQEMYLISRARRRQRAMER
jgi:hypothetical protein